MAAPLSKLRKSDILWLGKNRCAHRHTYLDHYDCFLREQEQLPPERVGFWDIESTSLKADYGQMLSWAIKDGASDTIYYDVITAKDIRKGVEDKRIVQSMVDTFKLFDRVVTFYGSRFDAPFSRTRALITGVEFPAYGTLKHTDAYMMARSRINLSSKRLENCCRQLLGYTNKTRIETQHWRGGMRGDKKALDYIVEHNCYDVVDLEKLYNVIEPFSGTSRSSI